MYVRPYVVHVDASVHRVRDHTTYLFRNAPLLVDRVHRRLYLLDRPAKMLAVNTHTFPEEKQMYTYMPL
jgi:hypothetical protein